MSTVKIKHKSVVDKAGVAKITSGKTIVRTVKAMYSDGRIMDEIGECWTVKASTDADATYETVAAMEV